ncbi:MAG: methylisocitrate lyase [Bacteroidia bacterium]|nr:methylisocitrate lyase [Bacteroidia bacterium]MCX7764279.1 methylisocitrate lyase [Bacteroidia bacterium]MDW8058127.1 methylisocitrate lyase [Bacteroidia bacterium]
MKAWLLQSFSSQERLAEAFRERIRRGRLILPGAHDPLAALLAKAAGFEALYLSGAAFSASLGLPDLGLLTLDEIVERSRAIVRATDLPLLVDVDTGLGEALNAIRLARHLVEARAAAIQLEDQEMPKKCGHLSGKRLISPEAMAEKIHAVRRFYPSLVIVARTDAQAIEGIEGVIRRARLYIEAGADVIFPEALTTVEEFQAVRAALTAPLLANLTEFGKSPLLTAEKVFQLGYEIALFPVSALRIAAKAMQQFYSHLHSRGETQSLLSQMQTRSDLYELLGYHAYEEADAELARRGKEADLHP